MSRHPFENQRQPSLWEMTSSDSVFHRCFSDEIAIDFPSVEQLVERERDVFLGERVKDVLSTEVSVSRRDANIGAVVPLDVPLPGTCLPCGGRGETWSEPCASCRGTGNSVEFRAVRFAVPPGVADGARFRFRVRTQNEPPTLVEVRVAIRSSAA